MTNAIYGSASIKPLQSDVVEQPAGTIGAFEGPLLSYDAPNRNGDVVPAGTLPLEQGVAMKREHDLASDSIAVFSTVERDGGQWVTGHWLDTPAGNAARTEALARVAMGGEVGISYGIQPDKLGEVTAAEKKGGVRRKLGAGRLVEVSQVASPAVDGAGLRQVASEDSELEQRVAALEERVNAGLDDGADRSASLDEREAALDAREAELRAMYASLIEDARTRGKDD